MRMPNTTTRPRERLDSMPRRALRQKAGLGKQQQAIDIVTCMLCYG